MTTKKPLWKKYIYIYIGAVAELLDFCCLSLYLEVLFLIRNSGDEPS